MLTFLAIFAAVLGSLVVVFVYTERQGRNLGIATPGDRYYYLWTYGPTAIFMILTAGWTQVEYRAMQLMPWLLMSRGPTRASESIFLDYMSILNVVSLYKSLKRKHFLVSLCVTGTLLLNAVSVFSTGLFELENTQITRTANFTITHQFDGSNWDPLLADGEPFGACLGFTNQNMSRPIGHHGRYVYPPFQSAHLGDNGNYSMRANHEYEVDLDVFDMVLDCEPAMETFKDMGEDYYWEFFTRQQAVFKTKDGCWTSPKGIPSVLTQISDIGIDAFLGGCNGETVPITNQYRPDISWDVDWRLWAMIGKTMVNAPDPYNGWQSHNITTAVCKLRYNMSRGPVKIGRRAGKNTISSSVNPKDLISAEAIPNVTDSKLLYGAFHALELASTVFTDLDGDEQIYSSSNSSKELWYSPEAFVETIKESYTCIATELVKNSLLVQNPHNATGTETATEQRLFVRPLSFWLMAGLMSFLIADVAVLLCFYVPVTVCPRDTGSIGGLATVLARSSEFMSEFQGSTLKPASQMARSALGQLRYSSYIDPCGAFKVAPERDDSSEREAAPIGKPIEEEEPVWWRPVSSTLYVQLSVVIVPLAVIAGLEAVYHISENSYGITLVEGKSSYIHYIWVYIPALTMFGIRCLFQSVEFGARIFQPYIRLREGAAPPETSILENQLRKVAVFGVFDTLRKNQWGLATATLALLLAAATPIVVAGLYTTSATLPVYPCNLIQGTRWNLGQNTAYRTFMQFWAMGDYKTKTVPGMIIHMNLSYPQWTHRDLVFPQFILNGTQKATQNGSQNVTSRHGYITARLPALRPRLDCHENKAVNCSTDSTSTYSCEEDDCFEDSLYLSGGSLTGIGGSGVDTEIPPSNCSNYRLLYDSGAQHHVIDCKALIESVYVDVRMDVPSFSFDPEFEPRVVEGSARQDIRTNFATFPGFDDMKRFLIKAPPAAGDLPSQSTESFILPAMIDGLGGVPEEELYQPDTFMARFNEIWSLVIAQLINTDARESFDGPPNPTDSVMPNTTHAPVFQAEYHDGRKYLVQSKISTRILDGLLAAMVLCGVTSLALIQTRHVLPKNPCSVAAVASFLYGARMLGPDVIPKGAEWCSDEGLKQRGVFVGQTFTMGWWSNTNRSPSSKRTSSSSSTQGDALRSSSTTGASNDEISSGIDDESQVVVGQMSRTAKQFQIDVDLAEERQLLHSRNAIFSSSQ